MSKTPSNISIRPGDESDLAAVTNIYAQAVLQGTGTFETEAPAPAEISRRRQEVLALKLPWLVAQREGVVLGYAYANRFRPREAYRFCLEDSVYLLPGVQGQGIGRLLLAELVACCESLGARQMLAVIGDSNNLASIGVHRSLGFEQIGLIKNAGWKFGRWLDVVIMQKELGQGARTSPMEIETPS